MKKWNVHVELQFGLEVEAKTEEEAITKAIQIAKQNSSNYDQTYAIADQIETPCTYNKNQRCINHISCSDCPIVWKQKD